MYFLNSYASQEVKREEILLEKDECLNERSKMELKHARAVHDITQELERKTILIHELEKQMQGLQAKADEAKVLGKMAVANDLTGEVQFLSNVHLRAFLRELLRVPGTLLMFR